VIARWHPWLCLAWLLWIPGFGTAGTPMIAAGPTSVAVVKPDGTVLTWGRDDSGVLGDGRPLYQTTLAQVYGLNVGGGITQSMVAAVDQILIADARGRVWAWGDNTSGQLGDGSTRNRVSPALIAGLSDVRAVSAGLFSSVFLKSDGTVWSTNSRGGIEPVPGLSGITAIAAGISHSVALKSDRTVWTWGLNFSGQLGDGTTTTRYPYTAAQVPGVADVTEVAASGNTSLALKADGSVWGWGDNRIGQIADGGTQIISTPARIPNLAGVAAISFGGSVRTLMNDGSVWRWGSPDIGRTPNPTPGLSGITRIAMGSNGSLLALKADGTLWGTGNSSGELGVGTMAFQSSPVQIPGVSNPAAFALGDTVSVIVKPDGTVWTAGSNAVGQLGTGVRLYRSVPATVPGLGDVVALSSGGGSSPGEFCTVAVKADGTLWGWGSRYCLYGLGDLPSSSLPVALPGWSDVSAVSVGSGHAMVLKSDGTVWTGGSTFLGALGNGTNVDPAYSLPAAPVPGLSGMTAVAAGDYYSLALGDDGTLWAWGNNDAGQLGDGTNTNRPSPVRVGSGYSAMAAGTYHTVAIKSDGTLWAWGRNDDGQLGDGTTTQRLSPVQIGSGYAAIALGADHTLALKTDGTLWAWGRNDYGQLGDGTMVRRPSPLQIGSGYRSIAVARNMFATKGEASLGIKTDGTVWAWGGNDYGQLGNGTFVPAPSPDAVVNESVTGLLDLDPAASNVIVPGAAPKVVLEARRLGGIAGLTLGTNVYFGAIELGALASGSFSAAGPYKVYVAAVVPESLPGIASGIYLLETERGWTYYAGGALREYASNVVPDATLHYFVSIFNTMDLTRFAGTRILVGYGTDGEEMLAAQRYREIFVVQQE